MINLAKAILGLATDTSAAPVASKPEVVNVAVTTENKSISKPPIEEIFRFPVVAHSFDLTKIMLHMTIATLFYMRALLPDTVFSERNLRGASFEKGYIYSQIINGKGVGKLRSHRADYVPTRIIERNMNDVADHFLKLLVRCRIYLSTMQYHTNTSQENGIFEAIRQGNLHAVQFTIFDKADKPEEALESYTFTFDYNGNRGPADRRKLYSRIDIVDIVGDKKAWRDVIRSGEALIRQLITMCARFPTLPNERFMGIHVFYKDECDDSNEIPGFSRTAVHDEHIGYPSTENWKKVSQFCGTLDSGYHTSGLRVSHLTPQIIDLETPLELLDASKTKTKVKIKTEVKMTKDMSKIMANEKPGILTPSARGLSAQRRAYRAALRLANNIDDEEVDISVARAKLKRNSQTPEPNEPADRILARKAAGQRALEEILKMQEAGQRPTVCKRTVHYVENRAVPIVKRPDLSPNGESSSHHAVDQIDDTRFAKIVTRYSTLIESLQIKCVGCNFTQHAECYGYRDAKDNRLPKIRYCYSCLIGDSFDSELMEKLKKLIRMRRAVKTILFEGIPPSNAILAAHLDCTRDEARDLVHSFRKLGLLTSGRGGKAQGFYKGNDPEFTFATQGSSVRTLVNEVLNPMLLICQYYYIPIRVPPLPFGSTFFRTSIPYGPSGPSGMKRRAMALPEPSKKRKIGNGVMFQQSDDGDDEHAMETKQEERRED
ncbi:uncharacterized protein N7511_001923 [Penicillium nucicola]|uniref:uncharacterized protein n=1 Tax=Penicillium nucicola TaxID=1850975 RepID=UPI00254538BA|nr:uncharacterized protein N7511_001923 [Penicillium nucicola]KAJ5769872.1 hypothetical protein N7511_001923 [Penicillium nucicola]